MSIQTCPHGHPLTQENVIPSRLPLLVCRECHNARRRAGASRAPKPIPPDAAQVYKEVSEAQATLDRARREKAELKAAREEYLESARTWLAAHPGAEFACTEDEYVLLDHVPTHQELVFYARRGQKVARMVNAPPTPEEKARRQAALQRIKEEDDE